MEREERKREMGKFFTVGQILSMESGQSKRFVALTDFDQFPPIIAHRTGKGRVYCPTTKDAMEGVESGVRCELCDKGSPRVALAAVSIWNGSDKVRQVALFSGPKKGTLHTLMTIFNTLGTHNTVIEITREGSGQKDTTYTMIPLVTIPAEVPEGIVPFTKTEIIELAQATMKERAGDAEW